MGYESRVIIARKNSIYPEFAENIAELNLCKVSGGFLDLFNDEYDGKFFDFYGCDAQITQDKYGKPLTYAPFDRVYEWLVRNVTREGYRRYDMLLALMREVKNGWLGDTEDFILIHYGY